MENIIWSGFSMALFAAILTATKKHQTVSDKLLSAWLFLFAIDYLNHGITSIYSDQYLIPTTFFLYNPAFYLYSKSLSNSTFKLKWQMLGHLFPYLFFELIRIFLPLHLDINRFFSQDSSFWFRMLFAVAMIASILVYNIQSIITIHQHRVNIKNFFSNIGRNQKITWLLFILIIYMIYVVTVSAWGFLGFISGSFELVTTYNYIFSLMLTFSLGFYGIRQEEIFTQHQFVKIKPESEERYRQSNLSAARKHEIKQLILDYFEKDKPYINPDLNMPMLSEELKIHKHQLTEVLNTEIGKNFFRFVNEYRVKEVKEKLSNPKYEVYSIEALAYECGFNCKSSFFSVFKSLTGKTPLQYRKADR